MRGAGKVSALFLCMAMLLVICLSGCSGADLRIDTDAEYDMTAPAGMEIFFSLPVYRIGTEAELPPEELGEEHAYVAGDSAELSGTGTACLDGMTVSLVQEPFLDAAGDPAEFAAELSESCRIRFGADVSEQKIRRFLQKNGKKLYLTTLYLSFNGKVDKPVKVDSLSIPETGFVCTFDSFQIEPCDAVKTWKLSEEPEYDDGELIDYLAYNGIFMDRAVFRQGYVHMEGVARTRVDAMQVRPLNDACVMLTPEHYDEICTQYDLQDADMPGALKESLSAGEQMDQDYSYVLTNADSSCDAAVVSLAFETIRDGVHYWQCVYQPSVVEGKYLLGKWFCPGEAEESGSARLEEDAEAGE